MNNEVMGRIVNSEEFEGKVVEVYNKFWDESHELKRKIRAKYEAYCAYIDKLNKTRPFFCKKIQKFGMYTFTNGWAKHSSRTAFVMFKRLEKVDKNMDILLPVAHLVNNSDVIDIYCTPEVSLLLTN